MKKQEIKNIAASVRAKLLNFAKSRGIDFNRLLLIYFQERFLYRLSKSVYKDKFILKGGVLFYGAYQEKARATKDIDLLAKKLSHDHNRFFSYIKNILSIEDEDGVIFLADTVTGEPISELAEYEGLRIRFKAKLDTAIITLQIDIGFSDAIFPHPISFDFPVVLGEEPFKLIAYSWESIIAEKFEAILKLGLLNSRMKDFYDIRFLQRNRSFNGEHLQSAIYLTLQHRKTDIKYSTDIFSEAFMKDSNKQTQWKAFLRKIETSETIDFHSVIMHLQNFLMPVIRSIIDHHKFDLEWDFNDQKWK
ncbi:MAG TPA: nucleotidyl transferase AbiEii/AbiGii toxin family protein [bacterium]